MAVPHGFSSQTELNRDCSQSSSLIADRLETSKHFPMPVEKFKGIVEAKFSLCFKFWQILAMKHNVSKEITSMDLNGKTSSFVTSKYVSVAL